MISLQMFFGFSNKKNPIQFPLLIYSVYVQGVPEKVCFFQNTHPLPGPLHDMHSRRLLELLTTIDMNDISHHAPVRAVRGRICENLQGKTQYIWNTLYVCMQAHKGVLYINVWAAPLDLIHKSQCDPAKLRDRGRKGEGKEGMGKGEGVGREKKKIKM